MKSYVMSRQIPFLNPQIPCQDYSSRGDTTVTRLVRRFTPLLWQKRQCYTTSVSAITSIPNPAPLMRLESWQWNEWWGVVPVFSGSSCNVIFHHLMDSALLLFTNSSALTWFQGIRVTIDHEVTKHFKSMQCLYWIENLVINMGWYLVHMSCEKYGYVIQGRLRGSWFYKYNHTTFPPKLPTSIAWRDADSIPPDYKLQ